MHPYTHTTTAGTAVIEVVHAVPTTTAGTAVIEVVHAVPTTTAGTAVIEVVHARYAECYAFAPYYGTVVPCVVHVRYAEFDAFALLHQLAQWLYAMYLHSLLNQLAQWLYAMYLHPYCTSWHSGYNAPYVEFRGVHAQLAAPAGTASTCVVHML